MQEQASLVSIASLVYCVHLRHTNWRCRRRKIQREEGGNQNLSLTLEGEMKIWDCWGTKNYVGKMKWLVSKAEIPN